MSKELNWRHYHLLRNGNQVNKRQQRYRRAWELIATLRSDFTVRRYLASPRVFRDSLSRATKGGHRMTAPVTAEQMKE